MAQQRDPESRVARRIRLLCPRRQGRDLPAGRSGAGLRGHGGPKQQRRRARALGCQRQATARGQIKPTRLPPGLDQHRPQRRTTRGFRTGSKHPFGIARPHEQDASGIEPEFGQTRRIQTAGLGIDDILPHPENRTQAGRPDSQPHGKARRRSEVGGRGRIDLMQRRPRDAAAQRPVETGRAEADLPDRRRRGAQGRLRQMAAQIGQGERVRLGLHGSSCSVFVLL